uniref:ELYS-bb domain-containing protein n=1 Tax=Heterorhabditis bacteriophora TaxID=37862 RepID=A0A1I7X8I5_HETBA
MSKIPDPLKQKFLPLNNSYHLEYEKFLPSQDDVDYGAKYLTNSIGELTSYFAVFRSCDISIHDVITGSFKWNFKFDEDYYIKDVDYLPSQDGNFGLVVALNSVRFSDDRPHCIALLHWNGAQFQILKKLYIEHEITCIRVLVCDIEMGVKSQVLHERMRSWPHIIVVGTKYAHCYLTHFVMTERVQAVDWDEPQRLRLTDGLKSFHQANRFEYSAEDPCSGRKNTRHFPVDSVYVSCIGFIERSRNVLIGLSFGGIISVSLSDSPTLKGLIYPCSSPIHFITAMEPDDDPRSHLWFWAAYEATSVKPLQLCLYEASFPDEETKPLHERTFDDPSFNIRLLHPLHCSIQWISLRTLVRERVEIKEIDDSTNLSHLNSSRNGSDKDRSLVFYSYTIQDRHGTKLMVGKFVPFLYNIGGLFDLNAYYYKRLVCTASSDSTLARQCAFLSMVYANPIHKHGENYKEIKDLAIDTSHIIRFVSDTSDAEQMFYPSALEANNTIINVGKRKQTFQIPVIYIAEWIRALGLVTKSHTITEGTMPYINLTVLLSALVNHRKHETITHFIRHCDNVAVRQQIGAWTWVEIERARRKMDETTQPLFARFSAPLSPAGRKTLSYVRNVFIAATAILQELLETGKREQDETREYLTSTEVRRFASENLLSYVLVIQQLMASKLLPVTDDRSTRTSLEQAIGERRKRADLNGRELRIDQLVTRMQRLSPAEPFWLSQTPRQWYPPALLNLLAPILLMNIPSKSKRQLLIYYMIDYMDCKHACATEDICELVTRHLGGVLSIDRSEVEMVHKMWIADAGKEDENLLPTSPNLRRIEESLEKTDMDLSEINRLMSMPRKLNYDQEKKLRGILDSLPYGQFTWQCYLVKNARFGEVEELAIPVDAEQNPRVMAYQQVLPVVRMYKNSDKSTLLRTLWSDNVRNAIQKFGDEVAPISKGKTPIQLWRRKSFDPSINARKRSVASALQQHTIPDHSSQVSINSCLRYLKDYFSNYKIYVYSDVPSETLNAINEVLRTPTSRARAAAAAEAQRLAMSFETTPEGHKNLPQPQSILKSSRGRDPSPFRPRLRFALPDSTKSESHIDSLSLAHVIEDENRFATNEADIPKQACVFINPNFDDDSLNESQDNTLPETEGGNDDINNSLEVQDDDEIDAISKNVDVQDENSGNDHLLTEDHAKQGKRKENNLMVNEDIEIQDENDINDQAVIVVPEKQDETDKYEHTSIENLEKQDEYNDDIMVRNSMEVQANEDNDDVFIENYVEKQDEGDNNNDVINENVKTQHSGSKNDKRIDENVEKQNEEHNHALSDDIKSLKRLVDYSFSDSTFMETPNRTHILSYPTVNVPDRIERSFEAQDENDDIVPKVLSIRKRQSTRNKDKEADTTNNSSTINEHIDVKNIQEAMKGTEVMVVDQTSVLSPLPVTLNKTPSKRIPRVRESTPTRQSSRLRVASEPPIDVNGLKQSPIQFACKSNVIIEEEHDDLTELSTSTLKSNSKKTIPSRSCKQNQGNSDGFEKNKEHLHVVENSLAIVLGKRLKRFVFIADVNVKYAQIYIFSIYTSLYRQIYKLSKPPWRQLEGEELHLRKPIADMLKATLPSENSSSISLQRPTRAASEIVDVIASPTQIKRSRKMSGSKNVLYIYIYI